MRRAICLSILMIGFVTASALAQQGGPMMPKGKWWRMQEVAKQLKLTTEQQTKLDAIFNASSSDLIDLKADVDKLGIELRSQLEKSQSARKDVLAVAQRLGVARSKLFEREIGMMVDMKAVLNDDQWDMLREKLEQRAERMREGMREPGPDGPDRPRPRNPR
jgi:Spy/CpxP family protein refolding chaperone